MHVIARAHPNIALIKYWGKRQKHLNLPAVGSLSVTLDGLLTETRLKAAPNGQDEIHLNGAPASQKEAQRIVAFLTRVRRLAGRTDPVCVETANNFPTASGLASSASGFAALSLAAAKYYDLPFTLQKLSGLAREGSGSAARSLHGGFVEWQVGEAADGDDSIAIPLAPAHWWDLRVNIAVTTHGAKAIGSREAMERSRETSPMYDAWVQSHPADLQGAREALLARDFEALATLSEASCHKMVSTWITSQPSFHYWRPETFAIVQAVQSWRAEGLPVFFTTDAGPHVKVICPAAHQGEVLQRLNALEWVLRVMTCGVGGPAQVDCIDG